MPDSTATPDSLTATSAPSKLPYRGRFAPSPTGPLHLGSLIAAVASYLDARNHNGTWLVRIDNLDPPREVPGAADSILNSLRQHGLHWDEEVLWQSQRGPAYQRALGQLSSSTFQCDCSRGELGPNGDCQRGCRLRQQAPVTPCATRISVPENVSIQFTDQLQGQQNIALGQSAENFLIHRKDGLYAYQLAVVVDDAHQGITHIVRGSDLLDTTARQQFLQQALGYLTPAYCHVPVITNAQGQKFSKQNLAPALDSETAVLNLRTALDFLSQPHPPDGLYEPDSLLAFAANHWSPHLIPGVMSISA
ncbi:MAG: tRNA glutamyl-Q(34) synthetase GluQRS [Proteobacteria bacterium]|nr:tRNA glutamyl-Q(34) synthetase GluQRS [Pseudomonadota bacterium]